MDLGEKITHLRKRSGLSQDALAHELNVSRQSISKWETGASTPELEKLVALCDLFHISLDELVRDSTPEKEPPAPPEPAPPAPQTAPSTQRLIGLILLTLGILSTLLGLLFLRNVFLLGLILVLYGAICLLAKRHAGLIIAWLTMTPVLLLHEFYTGIRLLSVLNPTYYQSVAPMNYILAWIIWLLLALLIAATCRAIKTSRNKP